MMRLVLLLGSLLLASVAGPAEVEGLWRYEAIRLAGGQQVGLDGLFLFRGDRFLQQSLNAGEPFDRRIAQAHAGTVRHEGDEVRLFAEVGLVVDPEKPSPVESRRDSVHRVRAARSGDILTLTFGTGTVQRLRRVGPGRGEIVLLSRGALALVDGRFILVAENDQGAAAGSGAVERQGSDLTFVAERWLEIRGGRPSYARDRRVVASLTGTRLGLPGGLSFQIQP